MKKILLLILLTFTSRVAWAEFSRSTTFDDRDVCVREKGVWREYGNSLVDSCEAKMDSFAIAAQVVTFSCDCGKNRCWNGEHCTAINDFKKIYDANQQKENKRLAQERKKRAEQYRKFSSDRIIALAQGAGTGANNQQQSQASVTGNNLSQFKDKFPQDEASVTATVSEVKNNPNLVSDTAKKINEGAFGKIFSMPNDNQNNHPNNNPNTPNAPVANNVVITDVTATVQGQPVTPASATNSDPAAGPTPFFLQQQEKAKQNTAAQSSTTSTNSSKSSSTSDLGLPEIPLPQ